MSDFQKGIIICICLMFLVGVLFSALVIAEKMASDKQIKIEQIKLEFMQVETDKIKAETKLLALQLQSEKRPVE